jgi:hypothetical protein
LVYERESQAAYDSHMLQQKQLQERRQQQQPQQPQPEPQQSQQQQLTTSQLLARLVPLRLDLSASPLPHLPRNAQIDDLALHLNLPPAPPTHPRAPSASLRASPASATPFPRSDAESAVRKSPPAAASPFADHARATLTPSVAALVGTSANPVCRPYQVILIRGVCIYVANSNRCS